MNDSGKEPTIDDEASLDADTETSNSEKPVSENDVTIVQISVIPQTESKSGIHETIIGDDPNLDNDVSRHDDENRASDLSSTERIVIDEDTSNQSELSMNVTNKRKWNDIEIDSLKMEPKYDDGDDDDSAVVSECSLDSNNEIFWKPFNHGWKREVVFRATYDLVSQSGRRRSGRPADIYYYTPTGKKLRSMVEVTEFLTQSASDLKVENFTFKKNQIYKVPEEMVRDAGVCKGRKKITSFKQSPKRIKPSSPPIKPSLRHSKPSSPLIKPTTPLSKLDSKRIDGAEKLTRRPVGRPRKKPRLHAETRKSFMQINSAIKKPLSVLNNVNNATSRAGVKVKITLTKAERLKKLNQEAQSRSNLVNVECDRQKALNSVDASNSVHTSSNFTPKSSLVDSNPCLTTKLSVAHTSDSTTHDTFQSSSSQNFKMKFKTSVKDVRKPCGWLCVGLEGVEPDLQCSVCMCLFHSECIDYVDSSGTIFVCQKCKECINTDSRHVNILKLAHKAISTKNDNAGVLNEESCQLYSTPPQAVSLLPSCYKPINSVTSSSTSLGSCHATTSSDPSVLYRSAPIHSPQPLNISAPPRLTPAPRVAIQNLPSRIPLIANFPFAGTASSVLTINSPLNIKIMQSQGHSETKSNCPLITTSSITINPVVKAAERLKNLSEQNKSSNYVNLSPSDSHIHQEVPRLPPPSLTNSNRNSLSVSAQVIRLPQNLSQKLDLAKSLSLKTANSHIVVPPSCLLQTSSGICVCLPTKTFDVTPSSYLRVICTSAELTAPDLNSLQIIMSPSTPQSTTNTSLTSSNQNPSYSNIKNNVVSLEPKKIPCNKASSNYKILRMPQECGTPEIRGTLSSTVNRSSQNASRMWSKGCINPAFNFIKHLYTGEEIMAKIFQLLSPATRLRCSMVCKSWSRVARCKLAWRHAYFSGITITDWQKTQKFLLSAEPSHISFRDMQLCGNIKTTFYDLAEMIQSFSQSHSLVYLDLGLVPIYVLQPSINLRCFKADIEQSNLPILDMRRLLTMPRLENLNLSKSPAGTVSTDIPVKGIDALDSFTNLTHLTLLGLSLRPGDKSVFGSLTKLQCIEVSNCSEWTDKMYCSLRNCTDLRQLHLSCGQSCHEFETSLLYLSKLKILKLVEFTISENVFYAISQLPSLKNIKIWPNPNHNIAYTNLLVLEGSLTLTNLSVFEWGILPVSEDLVLDAHPETVALLVRDGDQSTVEPVYIAHLKEDISVSLPETDVRVYKVIRYNESASGDIDPSYERYGFLRQYCDFNDTNKFSCIIDNEIDRYASTHDAKDGHAGEDVYLVDENGDENVDIENDDDQSSCSDSNEGIDSPDGCHDYDATCTAPEPIDCIDGDDDHHDYDATNMAPEPNEGVDDDDDHHDYDAINIAQEPSECIDGPNNHHGNNATNMETGISECVDGDDQVDTQDTEQIDTQDDSVVNTQNVLYMDTQDIEPMEKETRQTESRDVGEAFTQDAQNTTNTIDVKREITENSNNLDLTQVDYDNRYSDSTSLLSRKANSDNCNNVLDPVVDVCVNNRHKFDYNVYEDDNSFVKAVNKVSICSAKDSMCIKVSDGDSNILGLNRDTDDLTIYKTVQYLTDLCSRSGNDR